MIEINHPHRQMSDQVNDKKNKNKIVLMTFSMVLFNPVLRRLFEAIVE